MAKPTNAERERRVAPTTLTDAELDQVGGGVPPPLTGAGVSTAIYNGNVLASDPGRTKAIENSGFVPGIGTMTAAQRH